MPLWTFRVSCTRIKEYTNYPIFNNPEEMVRALSFQKRLAWEKACQPGHASRELIFQ